MSYKKQTNCNKSTTLETFSRFSKKLLTSTLTQLVVLQQCAWAYNDIVPPQNVQDNPINHIVIDPDRADNVTFESLSAEAESRLDNMGALCGYPQLVITTDQINNSAASVGYQTPALSGGDVLVLDTGEGGIVNNMGGRIETTNADKKSCTKAVANKIKELKEFESDFIYHDNGIYEIGGNFGRLCCVPYENLDKKHIGIDPLGFYIETEPFFNDYREQISEKIDINQIASYSIFPLD